MFVAGIAKGGFVLQNCHSGKMLCISQRSMNNGTKVIQYQDQELFYQKWILESVSMDKNVMKITNYNSGLLLSVQDSAVNNDATVIQIADRGLSSQQWEFIKLSEDINLQKLIKFFEPKYYVDDGPYEKDLGTNLSPELLQWYKKFIKMFVLEIFSIVGVIVPAKKQLTALNYLILGNESILSKLQALRETELSFDMIIEIVKLIKEEDLWNQIFRLLLSDIWSLPTLIKATAVINSLTTGVGTSRTIFLLNKATTVLGILYRIKPSSKSSSDKSRC